AGPMFTFALGGKFIQIIHSYYRFHIFPLPCREGNFRALFRSRFGLMVASGSAHPSPLAIELY
ncbi:MAG: hypothetical protein ACK42J_01080, partial [Alphaproteobacteria bacterium]